MTFSTDLSQATISLKAWIAFALFPPTSGCNTCPWNNTLSASINPPAPQPGHHQFIIVDIACFISIYKDKIPDLIKGRNDR